MLSRTAKPIGSASENAVHDDRGVNLALLAALPAAQSVLEIGCATGALGRRYKSVHAAAVWTGVDVNDASLAAARPLDRVHRIDLDVDSIASVGSGFDLIVLGDVLEHLKQPETLLRDLLGVCAQDARLVCSDFAVVLHRDNRLAIDPALGRNLWATDLCLQSIHGVAARLPQIVRIPASHNSVADGSLRSGYAESAQILARKYAQLPSIVTLDADIRSGGALCAPSFSEHPPAGS